MDLEFKTSKNGTVGIELEMRILDSKTFGVKNQFDTIVNSIDDSLKPQIHKELLKSMFEIVTPVCEDVNEAVEFLENVIRKIQSIGAENNFVIAALGTHPFEKKEENEIIKDPRYLEFEEEFQIILRNFLISGLHIHVGIDNEKDAIRAYNSAINYLPLFLALSTNSPFYHNEDTGLNSYRTKVFDKLPRAGIPEYFESYEEYQEIFRQLSKTGVIKRAKDIWWDVRLSPSFGTIELRVCDSFYAPKRLKFLTMFFQSVVEYSKVKMPKQEFHQINLQNKWSATRYSLDGVFIENGEKKTIREKIYELYSEMKEAGIYKELNIEDEMLDLKRIIEEPSPSGKLKEIYKNTDDFRDVLKHQIIGE